MIMDTFQTFFKIYYFIFYRKMKSRQLCNDMGVNDDRAFSRYEKVQFLFRVQNTNFTHGLTGSKTGSLSK